MRTRRPTCSTRRSGTPPGPSEPRPLGYFRSLGPRTKKLAAFLERRAQCDAQLWPELDSRQARGLFRRRAIVFTDTANFTTRTFEYGILHFLMLFERFVPQVERGLKAVRGRLIKVEGDSLLLEYERLSDACRGINAIETLLRRRNRGLPARDQLFFSYGLGWGDVLDLGDDVFGLEVNLASKLGEDLARPGEALLTPAAVEALPPALRRRLQHYGEVEFGGVGVTVHRLPLARR
jgi:adenylate cyclase